MEAIEAWREIACLPKLGCMASTGRAGNTADAEPHPVAVVECILRKRLRAKLEAADALKAEVVEPLRDAALSALTSSK